MVKQEAPSDWPRPEDELDDFPLAEERGLFAIRLNYADPFGRVINKTLDRLERPERYILILVEDSLRAEGLYTLPEARKVVEQMSIGSEGNFVDSYSAQTIEESVFKAVAFVKPQMIESELKELDDAIKTYEAVKRMNNYEWN